MISFLFPSVSFGQLLEPDWKKAVVLVEQKQIALKGEKAETSFVAVGTGFIVLFEDMSFLVTNKHIAINERLHLRFNPKPACKSVCRISIDSMSFNTKLPWGIAVNSDIAILPIFFAGKMHSYIDSVDTKSIGLSLFRDWSYVNEGDDIYILGFPLRMGTGTHFTPVIRSGIIALKEKQGEFVIEANVFPGNSGGPVFLRPNIYDYRAGRLGEGTIAYLIGIVSSYIPYIDVAISAQTSRPRITFEENSGLATAFSSERIIALMRDYIEKYDTK